MPAKLASDELHSSEGSQRLCKVKPCKAIRIVDSGKGPL